MAPTVTAVICAYWPERYSSLPTIVDDVWAGDTVPDSVIVFNNNPDHEVAQIPGAAVINSGRNFTSRSKYAVALLEPSDYYLLLDDDISVKPGCLKQCLYHAYPGCAFSDWGIQMNSNFITTGEQFTGLSVDVPVPVDAFVGIFQFVSFEAIVKMFAAEASVRLPLLPEFRSIGEDLLMGMVNDSHVIPLPFEDNLTSMPMGSESMQHDPLYGPVREIFVYKAWLALGHDPFPGGFPEDDGILAKYAEYLKDTREKEL